MRSKLKSTRSTVLRNLVLDHQADDPAHERLQSSRHLKQMLEVEAKNCKSLNQSHPWDQATLLREAAELLSVKDAEIAKLQAQVTKDANRLDWAAQLAGPDHTRDQISAWADQARAAIEDAG